MITHMTTRTPKAPTLGEFELLVLLAVLSLKDQAYPPAIARAIEERSGRPASRPSVQITLERLEEKGLLTSWFGDPTPVRGGRARRFFSVRPLALEAVREALRRIEAMTHGLAPVLKSRS
jgi:PadR family transcriptional regulator PadR